MEKTQIEFKREILSEVLDEIIRTAEDTKTREEFICKLVERITYSRTYELAFHTGKCFGSK